MKTNDVIICNDEKSFYPSDEWHFSPSEKYPEYDGEISNEKNYVYEMIRNSLIHLGLDKEHYGSKKWNPLGVIIKKNDHILIKPNWVIDHNSEKKLHNMDCLVTHPSIIRCILDYVLIALENTGKITVGDAPIQRCRLNELFVKMNYTTIFDYYKEKGIEINIEDFRDLVSNSMNKTISNNNRGILVNVGSHSSFSECTEEKITKMRVTNYPTEMMGKHHTVEKHEYYIHPTVLDSDVIINLPKPKSHRMAGLTACCKNFIGINCRKECLPHHTIGTPEDDGDEYCNQNNLHDISSVLMDKYNNSSYNHNYSSLVYLFASKFFLYSGKILTKEKFNNGCWYANDTIWRTINDLNYITKYCDKNGIIQNTEQRTIMHICDMIISGEQEGPLTPSPKKVSSIVSGFDSYCVDYVIAKMFGFEPMRVKYLKNNPFVEDYSKILIIGEDRKSLVNEYKYRDEWKIKPSCGWADYLEESISDSSISEKNISSK